MKKIEIDKVYHLLVCLGIAFVVATMAANAFFGLAPGNGVLRFCLAYFTGLLAAMAAGVFKEFKDSRAAGNHFCWRDLGADLAGALVGSAGAAFTFLL